MSNAAVPILMYHKIDRVNPRSTLKGHYVSLKLFERQMEMLAMKNYRVVPLSDVLSTNAPERTVAITFDDGYENFFLNALPVLVRHGYPATVFLVANALGGTNAWDSDAGDVVERLMNLQQIREALSVGIEFGSHSLDHADLVSVSPQEAWRQIDESKKKLEDDLARAVTSFCFPYGRKSDSVQNMVRDAGYRMACSTERGLNRPDTNPFALKRINIRRDTYVPIFMYKLRRDIVKHG